MGEDRHDESEVEIKLESQAIDVLWYSLWQVTFPVWRLISIGTRSNQSGNLMHSISLNALMGCILPVLKNPAHKRILLRT